jgi:hypothetical protein
MQQLVYLAKPRTEICPRNSTSQEAWVWFGGSLVGLIFFTCPEESSFFSSWIRSNSPRPRWWKAGDEFHAAVGIICCVPSQSLWNVVILSTFFNTNTVGIWQINKYIYIYGYYNICIMYILYIHIYIYIYVYMYIDGHETVPPSFHHCARSPER